MRKTAVAFAAASLALCASTSTLAEDYGDSVSAAPSAEVMAFDLVVIRPLGVVATVAGVALFVASLPIDLFTWNVKDPAKRLVVEPAKFTFTRDLGDIP
ncbi:MAG TPA: hypothetical protein VFB36_17200 [Nevskiaceae bacterium]|nr:hypothetical protein [Nevskiaceae bacterium]